MKTPGNAYTPRTQSGEINTSFSNTPRTIEGIDGAYKNANYAGCIQHYPGPPNTILWLFGIAVVLVLIAVALILFKG